jgi:hypothetical protein
MFFFSFFQVVRPTGVQQNEWAMFLPLAHEVYYIQLFCFSLTKGCLCTGRVYVVKKKILCFFFSLFLTYKNIMNSKNKNTQSPSTFSSVRIYSPRIKETPVEKKKKCPFPLYYCYYISCCISKTTGMQASSSAKRCIAGPTASYGVVCKSTG